MVNATVTFHGYLTPPGPHRKPTIYEALKAKLGREPTHRELCGEVRRILQSA